MQEPFQKSTSLVILGSTGGISNCKTGHYLSAIDNEGKITCSRKKETYRYFKISPSLFFTENIIFEVGVIKKSNTVFLHYF